MACFARFICLWWWFLWFFVVGFAVYCCVVLLLVAGPRIPHCNPPWQPLPQNRPNPPNPPHLVCQHGVCLRDGIHKLRHAGQGHGHGLLGGAAEGRRREHTGFQAFRALLGAGRFGLVPWDGRPRPSAGVREALKNPGVLGRRPARGAAPHLEASVDVAGGEHRPERAHQRLGHAARRAARGRDGRLGRGVGVRLGRGGVEAEHQLHGQPLAGVPPGICSFQFGRVWALCVLF